MIESPPALEGNVVLGRYRIVKPLARGGMGMVYLGRVEGAAGFAKPVVIKRILSEGQDAPSASHASFIREARILSELQHPGIVGVLDFGLEGDTYLMVLEYVHGYHLGHWLKYVRATRGEMEWEYAVYVLLRVLGALHYAHRHVGSDGQSREVIHRDVSPGNILIDFGGNVRLVDFGIARAKGLANEFETQDGVVKGKLPYIAPEIYHSQEASIASDVYAAGIVLYQLLSGSNPFSDRDMSKVVRRVLDDVPPPIASLRSDVPDGIDEIISKAIAKNPEERFASASQFASALSAMLTPPDAEIAERFRATVAEDFAGNLPKVLRVESLSSLDAAWRASAQDPEREPSLRSSLPPPDGQTTIVAVEESDAQGSGATVVNSLSGKASRSTRTLIIALALAFAATAGALAVLLLGTNTPQPESRFLLVERPSSPPASPATTPTVADPPTATTVTPTPSSTTTGEAVSSEAQPTTSGASPREPAGATGAQGLTAAFAKRQGAVQACFASNANALEGSPQITIRFEVAPSGAVNSASLSPAALAGTALGSCLLGVARSTEFPPQERAVAFSIPITARVVSSP